MAYIGNSPAGVGNYQVVDDISSTFNGVLTSFALTASSLAINPAKSGQLLVSINGVLQEPDDTGTEGFKVSGSNIVFSSAPATGSTFWAVWQGQAVDIGTPSDGVVGTTQLSATGTKSGTTYLAGDNTWKTVVTDLVNDTTPQLGGDLDLNGHVITGLSTDPTMGGDLSGTASNAQLGANVVGNTEVADNALSGNKIDGGTISNFTSTGIDDNATSTAITIDASENVGVGTTSPTRTLHVNGNVQIDSQFALYDNVSNNIIEQSVDTLATNRSLTIGNGTYSDINIKLKSSGNLRLNSGSGGIQFNGDTAAANALDDYEEGTWTPRVYQNGSNEITSPMHASGTYTKIGNQLHLTGYFYKNTSPTSASGIWEIWNLPYAIKTAVAGSYQYASGGYNRINNSYLGFNGAGGHGSRWQSNSASRLILYGEGQNNSWTTGNIEFSFNATFTV